MITKYSGETAYLNARIPIELFDRLEAKVKALDTTRSLLVRSILEMMFLSPDELKAISDRERAVSRWVRAGMPEPDPTAEFDQ
jgi:hypothetical protein